MTKKVTIDEQVNSNKKLKKMKKSGREKISNQDHANAKIKKKGKGDKIKGIIKNCTELGDVKETYKLTENDIEELKKPGNKKNIISKRQLKREKLEKAQKEQRDKSTNELIEKAWDYLDTWKNNKSTWKFQKVRQVWLTDNLFNEDKIPDNLWDIVVEYFSKSQGKVRTTIIEQSTKIVQEMSDWIEQRDQAKQDNLEFETPKPCKLKYKRARHILQCLQE
uniref:WKF domain-containing protein n=1 Tax=Xenopsylla cheopis TaxID=163159 RepID=A0A6M2DJ64_XENCH